MRGQAEVERVKKRGLPVVSKASGSVLLLPCPRHDGKSCTIYEDRPEVCGQFECWLLRDVGFGVVGFDYAVETISRLKVLAETIQSAFQLDVRGQALFDAAAAFFEDNDTIQARRRYGELLLDMAEFLQISKKRFGVQTDDPSVREQAGPS